ncbi:hypothetical protein Aeh1ORF006c [Aeromonas phage Aeh1]|uniref:Uncharacterized protein n=1 Tax=Aeromonas phage Aeh1 TaxID=2880362 RepID=Q76Z85_9CAUD|nr:MazG-like pyrophosphatase [Aeromonas phage Aeh1]AAQ17661.1 hypothetical protein Aeh1ORF006c [Aeromonas phage Aeh1]
MFPLDVRLAPVNRLDCEREFQKAYNWENLNEDQRFIVRGGCWNTWVMGWNAAQNLKSVDPIANVLETSQIAPVERSQHYVLGKCTEELGEAATVINKPHKQHPEPLHCEIADLIISGIDLVYVELYEKLRKQIGDNVDKALVADKARELIVNAMISKNEKWKKQVI